MTNEAKFTPGPWSVPWATSQVHGADLSIEARTKVHNNPRYIGRVYGPGPLATLDEETRANAALIAAAPTLYQALEAWWRWYTETPFQDGEDEMPAETFDMAHRALAAARGEQ